MAVNMYDQPAQAQFLNTYSPIPFAEIVASGQNKQQKYDTNRAGFERMVQEAEDLYAIPTSEDERYIHNVQSTMEELSDKYATQDYGNTEVVNDITRAIRKNINRRLVQEIQQSRAAWQQNQKVKAELNAKGLYDPRLDEPYRDYSTANTGIYTYQTPALLDKREKKENYFNNLEPSSYISGDQIIKYINDNQIDKLAKAGAGDYVNSGEGKQDILLYRKDTGDFNTPDEYIGYKLLYETGQEKKRRLIDGLVPEYASSAKKNRTIPPQIFPIFNSPAEEYPKEFSTYKGAKKAVDEYHNNRKLLESNLDIATRYGNKKAIDNATLALQVLDNKYALLEQEYSNINNEISTKHNNTKVEQFNKFKASVKEYFKPSSLNKIMAVAGEMYSDDSKKGMLSNFFETDQTSFMDAFEKKYGKDDPTYKELTSTGIMVNPKLRKIITTGGKLEEGLRSVNKTIDKEAEQLYSERVKPSVSRSYYSLPINNDTKTIDSPMFGNVPSSTYRIIEQFEGNPSAFKIETYSKDKDFIEEAYNPDNKIEISGPDYTDGDNGYINFTLKNSKGDFVKEGDKAVMYKMYLNNPSQMQAIAADYYVQGAQDLALKFARAGVAKQIEGGFANGMRAKDIYVDVQNDRLHFIKDPDPDIRDMYYLEVPGENNNVNHVPIGGKNEIVNFSYQELARKLQPLTVGNNQ